MTQPSCWNPQKIHIIIKIFIANILKNIHTLRSIYICNKGENMVGISESSARSNTNSTDQSIPGSQTYDRINDIKETTEDTSNSVKTGTTANNNAEETEQEESSNSDIQRTLAHAVLSNTGSVKLSDAPGQNESASAQYGA